MKNILIVHNYYQIPGGEDTVVANEKKLLEDNGNKVILYCRHNSEIKDFSIFQKIALPFNMIFNFRTYREIKRIIKQEKIDIVHVHNTLNLISPSVYYAALSCNVPVVQTVHNFRFVCPQGMLYRDAHICEDCLEKGISCAIKHGCYRESKLQTLLFVLSTKIHNLFGIYKKINYIILTDFDRKQLTKSKQFKFNKIFIKPNFVESYNRDIIPYDKRKNQYVFVGRVEQLKGIDVLLRAFKIIQDNLKENAPKLIVCGTGNLDNWCKEFIKNNDLSCVELEGFVDNNSVKDLLSISKGLIFPTQLFETFGMCTIESYSVGTPVFGSNIGNTADLIVNGVTGEKFDMTNPEDIANTILNSINKNYDLSDYIDIYSAKSNYKILDNIYDNALNKEK